MDKWQLDMTVTAFLNGPLNDKLSVCPFLIKVLHCR